MGGCGDSRLHLKYHFKIIFKPIFKPVQNLSFLSSKFLGECDNTENVPFTGSTFLKETKISLLKSIAIPSISAECSEIGTYAHVQDGI